MECFNATCDVPTVGAFSSLFTSVVQYFAASQCLLSGTPLTYDDCPDQSSFDFIIVGAGGAGSAVAYELNKVADFSILLLEAGDAPPLEANVPGLPGTLYLTRYDWGYLSTDDGRINQANIHGSLNYPRGKMIGGCTNINEMIYAQGNDRDFQIWCDAGNKEWDVTEVRRCYKKIESYQNQQLLQNPKIAEHYGSDGPLVINTINSTYKSVTDKILDAWKEIGFNIVPDVNSENMMGAGSMAATAANGERQSSNKAFLSNAPNRPNLKIKKNCFVTNILIDPTTKIACGVEAICDSTKYTYKAGKEVIISGGTINSPQLLMLSGVGPKAQLSSKHIKTIVDLPMVGQNLQDHILIPILIAVNENNPQSRSTINLDAMNYLYNHTGYLAQNSFTDIVAFFSSAANATYPDYQCHVFLIWRNTPNLRTILTSKFRYKDTVVDPIVEINKIKTIVWLSLNVLHPQTRGSITLRSKNPNVHPAIHPNFFKEQFDLESAVTGIKKLTKMVKTKYFKFIDASLLRMHWPACDKYELDSRDYWKCVCINMTLSIYHPVGTCMMGTNPKTSVVDSRLRVHGVRNLRVIDASIMPNITSGNTAGPAMMIGIRGAELIKEDYNMQ